MKLMRSVFVVLVFSAALFAQNPLYAPIPGGIGRLNCVSPLTCTTQGSVVTIDASSVGTAATGTGFLHYIAGVADAAAKTVDLASGDVTGILTAAKGGNGNGFFAVVGPATSGKTFTFPNADSTVLTSNAAVTVAQGGTGVATLTAHGPLMGEGTSAVAAAAAGNSGAAFLSGGASADGAYAAMNLAGGSNIVSGVLPPANGGVANAATLGGEFVGLETWPTSGIDTNQTVTGLINEITAWVFVQKHVQVVSHITVRTPTSLGGGKHWSAGVYDSTGTLLFSTGALDGTVTTIQTITITPVTMNPGTYYLAATADVAGAANTYGVKLTVSAAAVTQFLNNTAANYWVKSATATSGGVLPAAIGTLSAQTTGTTPAAVFVQP